MSKWHKPTIVAQQLLWLAREGALTPMQVLKLAYMSHGWMLGLYGRPLLNESVEAWTYGPVVPSVYHAYKGYRGNHISAEPIDNTDQFDALEQNIMEQVWNVYGNYSGIQLSTLTHGQGTPWAVTRDRFGIGSIISNDLIEHHYRRLAANRGV